MAGKLCSIVTSSEVALTAATAKTVLQLLTTSGTNLPRALIKKWGIFFDSTTTTAEPVVIKLIRQTTAGTSGSSVTPVAVGDSADTILCTAAQNFSAEPTSGNVLDVVEVHPQAGYSVIFPLGMEIVVPANTRLGIVATAPAGVNCHASIWFEE